MLSRYYIVLACIDRFALTSTNVKYRQFSQTKVAYYLIPITALVWFIIPMHIVIFQTIDINRCTQVGFYLLFFSIYTVIFATIIPPLSMILFILLIFNNLKQIRKRIQPTLTPHQIHIKQRDYQLMKMLWLQVSVYICSTLLYPPALLYIAITKDIQKNNTRLAIESLMIFLTTGFLIYINVSMPFYLYLFISKTFRKEYKQIIMKYCLKYLFKTHFDSTATASTRRIDDGLPMHLKRLN
ncbi:unnamed protein product [Didymodactylos carnosus]|uniref:G-protein coupled receptors family 1 profile domain-containing protein n=2 Tax=Didymodactylos carnosus TaxID=1234261 RepID=A0A8S2F7E9_9BILA|nr:unnamed protein product [Didymodactylos carnosus]CAF4165070.1 unnamed protein product [Didymodactylos carnosus]